MRATGLDGEIKHRDAALLFGNKSVPNFNQYIYLGARRESNEGPENEDEQKIGESSDKVQNLETKLGKMHLTKEKSLQPTKELKGIHGLNDEQK